MALAYFTAALGGRAETVTARAYPGSFFFSNATSGATTAGFSSVNDLVTGEMIRYNGILNPDSSTHWAYYFRENGGVSVGTMTLTIPGLVDADADGILDFYDIDRAITEETTIGRLTYDNGEETISGSVVCTWNRSAGSLEGTCTMAIRVIDFGIRETFTHSFDITPVYNGSYVYNRSGNALTGVLDVRSSGSADFLKGTLSLTIDQPNELAMSAGSLLDSFGDTYEFLASADIGVPLTRKGKVYQGQFEFPDGDKGTAEIDLATWFLALVDPGDSDGDGIPDFSDEPSVIVPPVAPVLELKPAAAGGFQLVVKAKLGQRVIVETANVLTGVWAELQNVVLSTETQTFDLPAGEDPRFIRTRTP